LTLCNLDSEEKMADHSSSKPGLPRCGLLRRLAAIAYDTLIVTGLLLVATALASPFDQGNQQAFRDLFFTLYLAAVWFFYIALCWMHGGMTVGMRAWKITLLADDDSAVGWKTCVLRFVSALFSAALFGLGFLWSMFDQDKRSWHDMVSCSGLYRI
jgi:uncharacterized RDD family membrane protein YckC